MTGHSLHDEKGMSEDEQSLTFQLDIIQGFTLIFEKEYPPWSSILLQL